MSRFGMSAVFVVVLFFSPTVHADAVSDLLSALGAPAVSDTAPVPAKSVDTKPTPSVSTLLTDSLIGPLNAVVPQVTAAISTPSTNTSDEAAKITELTSLIERLKTQLSFLIAQKMAEAQKITPAAEVFVAPEWAATSTPASVSGCEQLSRVLSTGSHGDDVKCIQRLLVISKFLDSANISGFFDTATEAALKQFQIERGIVFSGAPNTTGFGTVGTKTREAINQLLPFLAQVSESTEDSTATALDTPIVKFSPYKPTSAIANNYSIMADTRAAFSLRVATQRGGDFSYSIDWGDGATENGTTQSGVEKKISHNYIAGVYDVKITGSNELGTGGTSIVLAVDPQSNNGELIEIKSPKNGWTFDVVTTLPVSLATKDSRIAGSVRWFLQKSADAHLATGYFLGESLVSNYASEARFALDDIAPGTYWIQAIAQKFQDCSSGTCTYVLPTHRVGSIKISDSSNFQTTGIAPTDVEIGARTSVPFVSP